MKRKFNIISFIVIFLPLMITMIYISKNISFIEVELDMKVSQPGDFQVFFTYGNKMLNENKSVIQHIRASDDYLTQRFPIHHQRDINLLRIDLGTKSNIIHIRSMTIKGLCTEVRFSGEELYSLLSPNEHVLKFELESGILLSQTFGPDPYLLFSNCQNIFKNRVNKYWNRTAAVILLLIIAIILTLVIHKNLNGEISGVRYIYKFVLVTVFLISLSLPLIIFLLPGMQKLGSFDNRPLSPAPRFDLHNPFQWPADFGDYFEDRFGFRNQLIVLNNKMKAEMFKISAIPSRVMIGKDGWLFYTGDNAGNDYILNENPFSEDELEAIHKTLEHRKDWLGQRNIRYYIMVPPIKASIYSEFLPEALKGARNPSRLDQILDYFKQKESDLELIDLRPLFMEKKKEKELYYKTDTHWNIYGAYLGYYKLLQTINKDFPEVIPREEHEYKIIEGVRKNYGDLSYMLSLEEEQLKTDIYLHPLKPNLAKLLPKDEKYNDKFYDYKIKMQLPDTFSYPGILVFRDSYSNYLYSKIAEHFSTSTFMWTHQFETDLIEEEKPDIVVQIILERYIHEWIAGNKQDVPLE